MLSDLGHSVYREEFEDPFLKASMEFYKVGRRCVGCSTWGQNMGRMQVQYAWVQGTGA